MHPKQFMEFLLEICYQNIKMKPSISVLYLPVNIFKFSDNLIGIPQWLNFSHIWTHLRFLRRFPIVVGIFGLLERVILLRCLLQNRQSIFHI